MTKQSKGETITIYHGINRKTGKVERVHRTRGGMLTKYNSDGPNFMRAMKGDDAEHEVGLVFGLTDILSVSPRDLNDDYTREQIAELEAKAKASSGKGQNG